MSPKRARKLFKSRASVSAAGRPLYPESTDARRAHLPSPLGAPRLAAPSPATRRQLWRRLFYPTRAAQQRAGTRGGERRGGGRSLTAHPTARRGGGSLPVAASAELLAAPFSPAARPEGCQGRPRPASHETSLPPQEAETFPTRQAVLVGPAPSGVPAAPPQRGALAATLAL